MTHVATQTHELQARLKYPYWGLGPYHALAHAIIGVFDGHTEYTDTIQNEEWDIRVNYSKSGFAPRPEDPIDGDRLYEWDVTCRGPNRDKFSFNVSPRFPDQRHHETGDTVTLPWHTANLGTEGVDVEIQSSNVNLDRVPSLLRDIYRSIMTHAGLDYNHAYFSRQPHGQISKILTHEEYVRIRRDPAQKLTGGDLMMRILRLLADEKGSTMELLLDNTDVVGKMHKAVLNRDAVQQLWPGHTLGKQLKHYHLKNPDAVDTDDPTYHPKFGALFEKGKTHDHAVAWRDRDHLHTELQESLVNCLAWSNIPTKPDPTTYVPDVHFDPGARPDGDTVEIYNDPTPEIDAEQEHLLVRAVRDTMTDADVDVLETLVADGSGHVDDVAHRAGRSVSTIYRALDRLDGIIQSDNGHLSFTSRKYADELRDVIQLADEHVQSAAKRVCRILGRERIHAESGALQQWLDKYGADLKRDSDTGEITGVRIDTILSTLKSTSNPNVSAVLDELRTAWANAGHDLKQVRDLLVEYKSGPATYDRGYLSALC